VLSALRRYPSTPDRRRMVLKTVQYLRNARERNAYWRDKWHLSPYYATAQVIEAVAGLNSDLCRSAVSWILEEQHENGAWGFRDGTSEETAWAAYTMMAACEHDGSLRTLCQPAFDRGVAYLLEHAADRTYPALWIAKCLYAPRNVITAIILRVLSAGLGGPGRSQTGR
jgi:halimadienyl-diphosphate synthase